MVSLLISVVLFFLQFRGHNSLLMRNGVYFKQTMNNNNMILFRKLGSCMHAWKYAMYRSVYPAKATTCCTTSSTTKFEWISNDSLKLSRSLVVHASNVWIEYCYNKPEKKDLSPWKLLKMLHYDDKSNFQIMHKEHSEEYFKFVKSIFLVVDTCHTFCTVMIWWRHLI